MADLGHMASPAWELKPLIGQVSIMCLFLLGRERGRTFLKFSKKARVGLRPGPEAPLRVELSLQGRGCPGSRLRENRARAAALFVPDAQCLSGNLEKTQFTKQEALRGVQPEGLKAKPGAESKTQLKMPLFTIER